MTILKVAARQEEGVPFTLQRVRLRGALEVDLVALRDPRIA